MGNDRTLSGHPADTFTRAKIARGLFKKCFGVLKKDFGI
jgi:hypothetical protein